MYSAPSLTNPLREKNNFRKKYFTESGTVSDLGHCKSTRKKIIEFPFRVNCKLQSKTWILKEMYHEA